VPAAAGRFMPRLTRPPGRRSAPVAPEHLHQRARRRRRRSLRGAVGAKAVERQRDEPLRRFDLPLLSAHSRVFADIEATGVPGGLPRDAVETSIALLGAEIAPAVRAAL